MTKAERQKRWRQRRARGLRHVGADVEELPYLGALLESGLIGEDQVLDPEAISRATAEVLNEWTARWMR